jgi:hypothetical protein
MPEPRSWDCVIRSGRLLGQLPVDDLLPTAELELFHPPDVEPEEVEALVDVHDTSPFRRQPQPNGAITADTCSPQSFGVVAITGYQQHKIRVPDKSPVSQAVATALRPLIGPAHPGVPRTPQRAVTVTPRPKPRHDRSATACRFQQRSDICT